MRHLIQWALLALALTILPTMGWMQSPALWWRFEAPSPAADASGNGFDLAVSPPMAPFVMPGGVGSFYRVPDFPVVSTGFLDTLLPEIYDTSMFSFEMLLRPGNNFEEGFVLNWQGQFWIRLTQDHLQVVLSKTILSSVNVVFPLNGINRRDPLYWFNSEWHHLAITHEAVSGETRLYLDGYSPPEFRVFTGSGAPIRHPSGTQSIRLGSLLVGEGVRAMDYDEVALYDTLLTEEMVYEHYRNFLDGLPYSPTTAFVAADIPVVPCTETELNIMEFAEGFPSVLATPRDMQLHYPGARHLIGHSLPPIRPFVVDAEVLSGIGAASPVLRAQQATDIFEDLALHYNYAFLLGRTHDAKEPLNFTSPDFLGFHTTARAVTPALLGRPRFIINYWNQIRPTDIGDPNGAAYFITDSITPLAIMHYPPLNLGRWTTLSPLCFPDVANRLRTDGLTTRHYLKLFSDALLALGGPAAGNIDIIAENDEIFQRVEEAEVNGYPLTFTDRFLAPCPPLPPLTLTHEDYYSHRRHEQRAFYRDTWRPLLDSLNPFPTDVVWYNVADMQAGLYQYRQDRQMNLGPYAQPHKPTPYFYPEGVANWRLWAGAQGSYDRIIVSRRGNPLLATALGEFHYGDSLFQPFVSPGYSAPPASSVTDSFAIRPGQYLGLLKALAFLGADTYIHWDWQGGFPFNQPAWRTWKAVMPGYAQGVTTRIAPYMYAGRVLEGNHISRNPYYSFHTGDENNLVLARKQHGMERYAIMGAIERYSNAVSAGDKSREVFINLSTSPGIVKGHNLQFQIREQGSTYIYDRTDTANVLFYQLDHWHEWKDPSRWCRDFHFECENPDSGLAASGLAMHTETPPGALPGDYRDFTTHLGYDGAFFPIGRQLTYRFLQRNDGNPDLYGYVRARRKPTAAAPGNVLLELGGTAYNCPVADTAWRWYNLSAGGLPMEFSSTTGQYHDLHVSLNNNRVQIDKVFLTHSETDLITFSLIPAAGITNLTTGHPVTNSACIGDSLLFALGDELTPFCVDYHWTFGDGTVSYEWRPIHAFIDRGLYTVTCVFTENCTGRTDSISYSISIGGPDIDAGDAFVFCAPDSFPLLGWADTTAAAVWWTPFPAVAPDSAFATMAFADTTTFFTFHAVDDSGCVGIDSVRAEMLWVDVWSDNQFNDLNDHDDIDTMYACGDSAVSFFLHGHAWEVHWQPADMVADSMGAWDNVSDTLWSSSLPGTDTLYEFTVIAHDSAHCTADTLLIRVIVHPALIAGIATLDTTLCDTGLVTLNLDGFGPAPPLATYEWEPVTPAVLYAPGPLVPDPTVTLTSSTIFILTVTDTNGCVVHDTLTIRKGLPKGIIQDSIALVACAIPDSAMLMAFGGGTYNWTPTAGLSDPAIANPVATYGSPITYHCTIADTFGCALTDSVVIWADSCNYRPDVQHYLCSRRTGEMALDGSIPSTGGVIKTYTARTFMVMDSLVFDAWAIFNNCRFYMDSHAYIRVLAGQTATFNNCTFQAGCDEVWDGIIIEGTTAYLRVSGGGFARDAENAIISNNGGRYEIDNFTLRQNRVGILANRFAGIHPGRVTRTTFGSTAGPSVMTVAPYAGQTARYGVVVDRVNFFRVGETVAGAFNTFAGINTGVVSMNSVLGVQNNRFINLVYSAATDAGVAIRCRQATIPAGGAPTPALTAGVASAGHFRNTFTNCFRGIHVSNKVNFSSRFDRFTGITDNAIMANNCSTTTFTVARDTMVNCRKGVYGFVWYNVTGNIRENSMSLLGGFGQTGVEIEQSGFSPLTAAGYNVNVNDNIIRHRGTGVLVSASNHVSTESNDITIVPVSGSPPPLPIWGIHVKSGSRNRVDDNVIGSTVNSWTRDDSTYRGIQLSFSPQCSLTCNRISNVGWNIVLNGISIPNTRVLRNRMQSSGGLGGGMVLDNFGRVGDQGSWTPPYSASANEWTGSFFSQTLSKTGSNGFLSRFACRSTATYLPTDNDIWGGFTPFTPMGIPSSFSAVPMTCEWPPAPSFAAGPDNLRAELEQIALGVGLPTTHTEEARWWQDLYFHEILAMDTLLRDSVPLLLAHWNYVDSLAIGRVCKVRVLTAIGATLYAQTENSGLSPTCLIEHNSKAVSEMVLAQANDSEGWWPDSVQVATLREIAMLCPLTGGPAVYDAQSLLTWLGEDVLVTADCFGDANKSDGQASGLQPETDLWVKIVPQPARERFSLIVELPEGETARWEVMSLSGVPMCAPVDIQAKGDLEILCENWPAGAYIWRLTTSAGRLRTGKVVVVR